MPAVRPAAAVFGPFDGDFDPFEDDDEIAVLITFGRRCAGPPAGKSPASRSQCPVPDSSWAR